MTKRSLCQFVTLFLLGMGVGLYRRWECVAGIILFMGYVLWHIPKTWSPGKGRIAVVAIAMGSVLLGLGRGHSYEVQCRELDTLLSSEESISFQGELYKKEIKSDQTIYYLQDVILQREGQVMHCPALLLYPDSDRYSIGTVFVGKAKVKQFQNRRNEGNFDPKSYYQSNGIFAQLVQPRFQTCITPKWDIRQKLYELKKTIEHVYVTYLPAEESGIMTTIVLGDKECLDTEARDLFQMAGLSHILVISGLHISVVGMFLYGLLRKVGLGFSVAGGISFVTVFLYAMMSGMGNSTLRAVLMYGIMLLGQVLGSAYDSLTALGFVALIMVWRNPLLLQNTGFWLSFGAVIGVVTVGKQIATKGNGSTVAKQISTVLGVQLVLLPLLAMFYYEIPIYSFLLNLLLLPFVGVLLGAGLVGGFLGLFTPFLARGCLGVCHVLLYGFEWLSDASLHLPGARQIIGCPKIWQVLIYYLLLYLTIYCFKSRKGFWGIVMAVVILWVSPGGGFEMDVLDVGQGDGIFLQSREGVTFFVDGGSSDVKQVGKYRILPFLKYRGIRAIDYWFVSHTDEDHISGLLECMQQGYSIKHLVFSRYVVQDDNYRELVKSAKEHGIPIVYMREGTCCGTDSMKVMCLAPNRGDWGNPNVRQDANAMSMVLLVETGSFRALLTGDLTAEQERHLPLGRIAQVDVYKAAHHGSNGSSSRELLEAIRPRTTVISCSLHNSYGHPGEQAVSRITQVCGDIRYTMYSGQLTIRDGY